MIDRRLTFALAGLFLVNIGCGGESSPATPSVVATPTPTCAASQISIVNARFEPTQRVCALGDTTSRVNYDLAFDFVNASDLAVSITSGTLSATCLPGSYSNCGNFQLAVPVQNITPTAIPARGTTTIRTGVSHDCNSDRSDRSGHYERQATMSVSTSCGSAGASTSNTYRLVYQ
jgi:hypothetical protein